MPGFRISNANIKRVELGLSFSFGRRIHPGKRINPLAKCRRDIADHGLRPGLGFRREILLRIKLTDFISQHTIDHVDTALPARTLLRSSGEGLSKKCKTFLRKRL